MPLSDMQMDITLTFFFYIDFSTLLKYYRAAALNFPQFLISMSDDECIFHLQKTSLII